MPVLFTVAGVVVLLIGVGIGVASQQSKINNYKHQAAQLQGQLSTTKTQLSTTKTQLATAREQVTAAQANAKNAMSAALTQVKAQC
jgi:uncharacterized membrane-anchored protein YhcB (DUF1043 family)